MGPRPWTFASLLLVCLQLFAQTGEDTAKKTTSDPPQSGFLAQSNGQVTLSSTADKTDVRAEFGIDGQTTTGLWLLSLRMQAPISKGDETELANLSRLNSGTVASLRYTHVSYGRHHDPSNMQAICDEYNKDIAQPPLFPAATCTRQSITQALDAWMPDPNPEKAKDKKKIVRKRLRAAILRGTQATCAEYNKAGGPPLGRDDQGDARIKPSHVRDDGKPGLPIEASVCSEYTPPNATEPLDAYESVAPLFAKADETTPNCVADGTCWVKKLDDAVDKEVKAFCSEMNTTPTAWGFVEHCDTDALLALENGEVLAQRADEATRLSPWYYGLHASLRNDTFTYANTALEDVEENKDSIGFGGTIGHLFVRSAWYLGLTGVVERAFKGARASQLCQPIPDSSATTCRSIALKPPTHEDSEILQLEGRRYLTERIAIIPRVSYDFNEKVTGIEFITYLLTDPEKGLNGGIELGYRSDKDDPTIRVFIGTAFQLFGSD